MNTCSRTKKEDGAGDSGAAVRRRTTPEQNNNILADDSADNDEATNTRMAPPKDNKLLIYLVVGVMPFLYGISTRLPFIYFVIHLSVHFELNWWIIGLCVGAYQSGRVVINITTILAPKLSHFFGTAIGFAGYCTVLVCDKDLVAPFIVGTAVIGFSETVASMQNYVKEMFKYDPDRKRTQRMLKYQYASVMCGVMFAFSIGGILYQHYAINGVACFGMIAEGGGLAALVTYLVLFVPHEEKQQSSDTKKPTPAVMTFQTTEVNDSISISLQEGENSNQSTSRDESPQSSRQEAAAAAAASDIEISFYPSSDDDVDDSSSDSSDNGKDDEEDVEAQIVLPTEEDTSRRRPLFDDTVLGTLDDLAAEASTAPGSSDFVVIEETTKKNTASRGEVIPTMNTTKRPKINNDTDHVDAQIIQFDEEIREAMIKVHLVAEGSIDADIEMEEEQDDEETTKEDTARATGKNNNNNNMDYEVVATSVELMGTAAAARPNSDNINTPDEMAPRRLESSSSDNHSIVSSSYLAFGEETEADYSILSSATIQAAAPPTTPDHHKGQIMLTRIIRESNANYHTAKDLPATWVNYYLIAVSFGIEALTIGYNLSIGPIFLLNQFNRQTGITGLLFAVGAGVGSVIAIAATCTEWGCTFMNHQIAKSPYDLCFAMGGIAVGVFVAAIPIFPIHVVGLILLMAFNDLGATLMTEFQGSITTVSNYTILGPLGQVVRRFLNVVTAVTGPILLWNISQSSS